MRFSSLRRHWLAYSGLLLSIALAFSGCNNVPDGSGPWGHLHQGRYGAAAVTDGRYIYVIGGSSTRYERIPAERIDVRTGLVETLPWKLSDRRYHTAVLIDRTIWVFGGEDWRSLNPTIEKVDLATGTVSQAGLLKFPRSHLSAGIIAGRIMLVGGAGFKELEDGRGAKVEIFDPATETITLAPDFPASLQTQLAAANDNLFAIGGWNKNIGAVASSFQYDAAHGWTALRDLPFLLSAHAIVAVNGYLFSFGDYTELDRVARYDFARDQWTRIQLSYQPRRHATAVVIGNQVAVVGGNIATRDSALDTIEVYPISDLIEAPSLP